MSFKAEIICVGNELLIGKVLNTNFNWLATRLTECGGDVTCEATIRDDVETISRAIHDSVKRKPDLIILSGGLGPTHDDKTLRGLARALRKKLRVDKQALDYLKTSYARMKDHPTLKLTAPRVKMATLPYGTKAIPNPVGTAPAVMAKTGRTTIFALPGVPSELKAIFDQSVVPFLKNNLRTKVFLATSIVTFGLLESELSPLIDKIMKSNPFVYVKSHPKGGEGKADSTIELHFSTISANAKKCKTRLMKSVRQMVRLLSNNEKRLFRTQVNESKTV